MYIDLKKTLEEISRCLPEKGVPTSKQLQRMYELTLRLQSQELAVIYDMETFGSPAAQEQQPLDEEADGGRRRALEGYDPRGNFRRGGAGTAAVF